MLSSLTLLTLLGSLAPQIDQFALRWHRDYAEARQIGAKEQKPLIVFIADGADGWRQLVREGNLDASTRRTLSQNYVPLYVDQQTDEGKHLAQLFGMANKRGLIISDRTGGVMAFHHQGDLTAADLDRHLNRFADPNRVVNTTLGNAAKRSAPRTTNIAPAAYQNPYGNPFACQT